MLKSINLYKVLIPKHNSENYNLIFKGKTAQDDGVISQIHNDLDSFLALWKALENKPNIQVCFNLFYK